jgi:hypothetical protein
MEVFNATIKRLIPDSTGGDNHLEKWRNRELTTLNHRNIFVVKMHR